MSVFFLPQLEAIFGWILTASWQASVLALLVLLLQRTLGARLNPRWRYALWLLVLVRLVLPALPESAWSVFQFAPPPPAAFVAPVTEPLFVSAPLPVPRSADLPPVEPSYPFSFYSLLAVIWLVGAMALLFLTWQVNRRFARQIANSPEIADPELRHLFAAAKNELGISRPVRLIENSQVQSPAIMGLFQPTLLLPADVRDKFDARELRFIFLHELAHLKRGDVTVQALIALLQIVHWFNPVLWFAFRRMRIDREPATDALVLSRTGEDEKERYGLMLIKLLEHFNQRHSLPTLVGILEDKDQFKRRFSLIARFTRGAYGWSLLGILIIGILSVACLTKSKATETAAMVDSKPTVTSVSVPPMNAVKRQVQLEFKLIAIDETTYQSHQKDIDKAVPSWDPVSVINTVTSLPGTSLLSAPSVTTQDGLSAIIDNFREMQYATKFEKDKDAKIVPSEFKTRRLGFRIVALPKVRADGSTVDLGFHCQLSSFRGWEETSPGVKQPVFDTVTTNEKVLMPEPGCALWVGGPGTTRAYLPEKDGNTELYTTNTLPKRILLLITAHLLPAEAQTAPVTTAPAVADVNKQLPAGSQKGDVATTVSASLPITESTGKNPAVMIRIAPKVVQIDEDDYQAHRSEIDAAVQNGDMEPLSRLKSFDLLTQSVNGGEPVVLTKSGERGVIEAVRVFPYPIKFKKGADGKFTPTDFTRQNLGVRFVVFPTFADNKINFKGDLNITSLEGWTQAADSTYRPNFHVREASVSESFGSGQTKGFEVPGGAQMEPSDPAAVYFAPGQPPDASKNPKALRRIFFFLNTQALRENGKPMADQPIENAPAKANTNARMPLAADESSLPKTEIVNAPLNDQKLSRFVEKVNATFHAPDSQALKTLFYPKDIPDMQQAAINAWFESFWVTHLVGNTSWKISVIPVADIPSTTKTNLNAEPVCGLELLNVLPDKDHRLVFPVCTIEGEYLLAESKTASPSALMLEAVKQGDTKALQKLFDQGFDPNADKCNPVYWAVYYHQPEILRMLLAHNAETDRWDPPGDKSPLELARSKFPDLVPILQNSAEQKRLGNIARITGQLNSIRVDHLSFKDTPLIDVINALQEKSTKADPNGDGPVFILRTAPSTREGSPNPASQPVPTITLTLTNVSLADAIKTIANAAHFQYSVEEYAVYLRPAYEGGDVLSVRTFLVPASFFTTTPADHADVRPELIAHGIAFPTNTTAIYLNIGTSDMAIVGKIVVHDTPEQLDKLATLIEAAAQSQAQTWLQVDYCETAEPKTLGTNGPLTNEQTHSMVFNPTNKITAAKLIYFPLTIGTNAFSFQKPAELNWTVTVDWKDPHTPHAPAVKVNVKWPHANGGNVSYGVEFNTILHPPYTCFWVVPPWKDKANSSIFVHFVDPSSSQPPKATDAPAVKTR